MFRMALPVALVISGCSLLVQFDPESQPCDADRLCLPGYLCGADNKCRSVDGGGGIGDGGGQCVARETQCTNGNDDDCDGVTDCADTDCLNAMCNDGDACTVGEACSNGTCRGGSPKQCPAPTDLCLSMTGTCEAGTGRCTYQPRPDGAQCGSTAALRCCNGVCINTTINSSNCGGCGLACGAGQRCQPIDQSTCGVEPIDTSGRCSCNMTTPCPKNQTCDISGYCVPIAASNCATGQMTTTIPTCQSFCAY